MLLGENQEGAQVERLGPTTVAVGYGDALPPARRGELDDVVRVAGGVGVDEDGAFGYGVPSVLDLRPPSPEYGVTFAPDLLAAEVGVVLDDRLRVTTRLVFDEPFAPGAEPGGGDVLGVAWPGYSSPLLEDDDTCVADPADRRVLTCVQDTTLFPAPREETPESVLRRVLEVRQVAVGQDAGQDAQGRDNPLAVVEVDPPTLVVRNQEGGA